MTEFFLNIVNMSISACWIVLAILLFRLVLKKAPKWINCVLWGIAGLRLVMPFSFESVFSLVPSAETITKVPDSPRPQINSGVSVIDNQINDYLQGNYFEGVTRPMGNFVPSFLSSALQICLSLKFIFLSSSLLVIVSALLRCLIIPNYLLVIKNESLHYLYYFFDQSPLLFLPVLEFVRAVSSSNLSFFLVTFSCVFLNRMYTFLC